MQSGKLIHMRISDSFFFGLNVIPETGSLCKITRQPWLEKLPPNSDREGVIFLGLEFTYRVTLQLLPRST